MGVRTDELPVTWDDGERSPHVLTLLKNNKALTAAIEAIEPEVMGLGERKLENRIREAGGDRKKFPQTLGHLKIQFWEEYRLAVQEKRQMRAEDIFHGVCLRNYWVLNIIENPTNLAWLLYPPVDELVLQKEIIQHGMKKLLKVFEHPIHEVKTRTKWVKNEDGERVKIEEHYNAVNVPLLREMHNILRSMQDRVHGSVIKREQSERKSLHLHASTKAPMGGLSIGSTETSMDDLDAYEKKLDAILKKNLQITAAAETPTVEGEIIDD